MNYIQIEPASVSNGIGFRVALWVSGCSLHCHNCQNIDTWDFGTGLKFDDVARAKLFSALSKNWVRGLTLTGGHPLEVQNIDCVYSIITQVREKLPDKDIWLYTGLTLSDSDFRPGLLYPVVSQCDVIVDGPYIDSLRDITLPFKGSSNQRVIDVKKTLSVGEIVEMNIG